MRARKVFLNEVSLVALVSRAWVGSRAAAAVATISLLACTVTPVRDAQQITRDEALGARVEQALARDPRIYARHIDVDAERGVVRLSGFVFASEDLWEAKRVSEQVPGVIAVRSEIELQVGGRGSAR